MKYIGTCHCKKVSYQIDLEIGKVVSCNCSYCHMKGLLLTFASADSFALTSGRDDLTSYHFNKKVIEHLFCRHCGVQPFSYGKDKEGKDTVAVNVRCLEGVDIDTLDIVKYDGRNI